jgi:tetratricopeptide (TPR) repeat protein
MGRSLINNSVMQGLVYRLERGQREGSIDLEKTRDLFWNVFRFRSINDSTIHLDERSASLTGNYTTGLLLMADSLRALKQYDQAVEIAQKAVELIPFEYSSYNYLAQLYVYSGQEELIPGLEKKIPPSRVRDIYFVQAITNKRNGNRAKAEQLFKTVLDSYPKFEEAFTEYSRIMYEDGRYDELQQAIREWLTDNPNDENARRLMQELSDPYRRPAPPPTTNDS